LRLWIRRNLIDYNTLHQSDVIQLMHVMHNFMLPGPQEHTSLNAGFNQLYTIRGSRQ